MSEDNNNIEVIGTNLITSEGREYYRESVYYVEPKLDKDLIPFHFGNMTVMMKRPIGVDAKGRIRWRRSKKNPVVFTKGIIRCVSDLDIMEGFEKWKKKKSTKTN